MLKLMIVPRTRAGMSRTALQHHLEQVHGPLCLAQTDVGGHFRRYIHHYVTSATADPLLGDRLLSDRDALTTISLDNFESFQASISSAGYCDVIGPDEDNFREVEGSLHFFVDEIVLKASGQGPIKLFHLRRFADGRDHAQASRIWRDRITELLGLRALGGLSGYLHNLVLPGQGPPLAYDAIDEISLGEEATDLTAAAALLSEAEQELFDPSATAALVTRPKAFIS